jgi:HSP20 family protein
MDNFVGSLFSPNEAGFRWLPNVSVTENPEGYVVTAEIPGLVADDVEVTFENQTLSIKGEKKSLVSTEKDNIHVDERRYGTFARAFTFPAPVDAQSVDAETRDGLLTIRLAKAKEAQARRIQIKNG